MKLQDVQETIIEMRNNGYGYRRIAKALNANPASVKRWIAILGLPTALDSSKPESAREIQCVECGTTVETVRFNTTYCSNACRLRARKIKVNGRKKCIRCKGFIYGAQNVNHCSDECKHKDHLANRTIRLVTIQCIRCGNERLSRRKVIYCSDLCRKEVLRENSRNKARVKVKLVVRTKHTMKCKECASFFETTKSNSKYCSKVCGTKYSNRRRDLVRRGRVLVNGKVDWSISINRLTKRDGRNCSLCNKVMNYSVDNNHNDYPSIEHVKPISKGGTHTWDNVKLAHRKCNSEKSNKFLKNF